MVDNFELARGPKTGWNLRTLGVAFGYQAGYHRRYPEIGVLRMQVTITEAARHFGVAEKTVRRRVRTGDLTGTQVSTPQGFTWMVDLPENEVGESDHPSNNGVRDDLVEALKVTIKRQDELMGQLIHQLESREREVQEVHVLLQQFSGPNWRVYSLRVTECNPNA